MFRTRCILFSNRQCNGGAMKQIHKKYLMNMILIWMGCFILFLFVYIIILAPQNKTKKQVQMQLAHVKKKFSDAQQAAKISNQEDLKKKIEDVRQNVNNFVISFEDSANLTFDISQIADRLKVIALSIKSKGNQPIPDCKYISQNQIYLSFSAAFNQFFTLLNELERHRPVIFIDKFAVTRLNSGYYGNEISMELSVFVTKREDVSKNSG